MTDGEQAGFPAACRQRLERAGLRTANGRVLPSFPHLPVVAVKT